MRAAFLIMMVAVLFFQWSVALAEPISEPPTIGVTVASAPTAEPVDPNVPETGEEALEGGKQLVDLAKTKQWFALSAGVIWLLMFAFKWARKNVSLLKRIPKRALWITLPILSVIAMLLAKLQGDLTWTAALGVLLSGPSVAFLNDLVKRGILNQEPSHMGPVQ